MKMIEISEEKFENFRNKNKYDNFCQTSNYGSFMKSLGYNYNYIAYTTNDYEILAAGLVLTKKIGKTYYYAYCPKGFLIDYSDSELVKKFTKNIIKYYKRRKIVFLKINPEVPIATIDSENNYERIANENESILNNLKSLGFKKRKEINPFDLLEPKLTSILSTQDFNIDLINNDIKKNIDISKNNGLELIEGDLTKIEYLYDMAKDYTRENLNYYKDLYTEFKKDEKADLMLVRVNYETYLINAKKRVEQEQDNNNELNKRFKNNTDDEIFVEKMKSDKDLEKYKQDIVYATNGLKNNNDEFVAGALIIKHNNKVSVILSGKTDKYDYLYPDYYLYYKIIEKYKEDYEYIDFYGIANDFDDKSKYYQMNKLKTGFNKKITEYIGELDLIISEWRFKIVEKNNSLSNEFTKQKN